AGPGARAAGERGSRIGLVTTARLPARGRRPADRAGHPARSGPVPVGALSLPRATGHLRARSGLDLDDVPGASYVVACELAGGLVADVEVEGIAVEGDLPKATRPGDDAELARQADAGRGLDRGGQRRPGGGTGADAGRLAAVPLVRGVVVQGQAAAAGQHRADSGVRDLEGRGP